MRLYETIQGDTWDMIAYKEYGEESRVDLLMEANQNLLKYFVFPAGVEVIIPDYTQEADYSGMPDWRNDED